MFPLGCPRALFWGHFCLPHSWAPSILEITTPFSVQYADDVTMIQALDDTTCPVPLSYIKAVFLNSGLKLNVEKCKAMTFRRSRSFFPTEVLLPPEVEFLCILGVTFSNSLSWSSQFSELLKRCSRRLHLIRCLRHVLPKQELITVYHSIITSVFLYASPAYGRVPTSLMTKLEAFQKRGHKLICGNDCQCAKFPPLSHRFREAGLKFLHKSETHVQHPLHHLVPLRLPITNRFRVPFCRTTRRLHSFFPWFTLVYNSS